jgi:cob(I)alamin adenosyltransferase
LEEKDTVDDIKNQTERSMRGLNLVFTGNGKGKTSAAMGILARASGHGLRVGVIQFIKSQERTYGEALTAKRLNIPFQTLGSGFIFRRTDQSQAREAARKAWEEARAWIGSQNYDVIILDEITYLFAYGWVDVKEAVTWLEENKPPVLSLVMTGRKAPPELIEYADLVTEMQEIKHHYREQKIPAQRGIDY